MKRKYFLLSVFFLIFCVHPAYSQDVRSNHSYRNLGFTQVPTVSVGGFIDVNLGLAKQEDDYFKETLNNVVSYNNSGLSIANNIKNRATDDLDFAGEASVIFTVNGINDYGFKYGAVMELNANCTYNSWDKE